MSTVLEHSHRLQQVRKLTEISRAITYAASFDEVFQLTVDRAADLLDAGKSLLLIANADGVLALCSSHGLDPSKTRRFQEPMNETLFPRLAELIEEPPETFLGVPLVTASGVRGLLVVIRRETVTGSEEDEWLLSALADQAALALERMRLGEIAEFREQLIGIVGHDLRDPLNSIMMTAQMLVLREGLGEIETKAARRIASGAARAARLIDQLLDLTRSRLGGGISIDRQPLDLGLVVKQVIGELEISHPDRPIRVEAEGDLAGTWDRDRIAQLIGNLMGNALQHGMPGTPIDLGLDGSGGEVVVAVRNCGTPIPPETLPFIFEAFRRGRKEHPSRKSGLGLGLFIAQQIAHSHDGSIEVSSSETEGTTFRLRLPRRGTGTKL